MDKFFKVVWAGGRVVVSEIMMVREGCLVSIGMGWDRDSILDWKSGPWAM